MKELRDIPLRANARQWEDYLKKVKEIFGSVSLSSYLTADFNPANEIAFLELSIVLPNFYRTAYATIEKAPLFVLIPDKVINCVWPGKDFEEIKYGTALGEKGEKICSGIGMHKDYMGLYLCLSPHNHLIKYIGSLGI